MPWKESGVVDQRLDCVRDALSERFTMVELCARYGVSRRIGYKWLGRFAQDGKGGLRDRSRRPHTCPTATRPVLAELVCEFRRLHPAWGAFRFRHRLLYVANALVDQYIGLEETDDGVWSIYFNTVLLATLNGRDVVIRR